MKKKFEKLNQPLQRLIENLNYNEVYFFSVIKNNWQKIVGLPISKYVEPVEYNKSKQTLYLKSNDKSWEREIINNKKEFIHMIKKNVKNLNLKNVIFVKGFIDAK